MVIISASMRKLLQGRTEEEASQLAAIWGITETPADGWLSDAEQLGEQMQDLISTRFAWESLSALAQEILHQVIAYEVTDGIPTGDLQTLVEASESEFAAALEELNHCLMLVEEKPGTKVKHRLEARGAKITPVLAIPRDLCGAVGAIAHEVYDPAGDRSKMTLIELLKTYDSTKLQEINQLYSSTSHNAYYNYSIYSTQDMARSLTGKLVQSSMVEFAWSKLDATTQKLCRWLCQHEGNASVQQARAELGLDNATLSVSLHLLEDYALVFDTFSGSQRRIFVGRGIYKVLHHLVEELDQLLKYEQQQPSGLRILTEPPTVVREAECLALYDLAIIIGSTYQQPIEPTQAGYIPKRIANKLIPLLHTSRMDSYGEEDRYLDILFRAARQLDLLQLVENVGQKPRFMPGDELSAWAAAGLVDQTRQLLDLWWNPANYFWSDVAGANFRPSELGFPVEMRTARQLLLQHLQKTCKPGTWYTLKSFLANIKETNYLFLHPNPRQSGFGYSNSQIRRVALSQWDQTDGEIITGLLASSLYEFGLVSLGYAESATPDKKPVNPIAFKLTALAARIFEQEMEGADEELASYESGRTLIVQPNFELLLLRPDYSTLYRLLPFTKIGQIGMVSRLNLTQESVRRGVEAGWSLERIQKTLQELSQKELPQNVFYTLQDWGKLYKDIAISQILLLEVTNESTADEILASAKFHSLELRRLGPCALAVGGQITFQVLRTALEKEGLIVRIQGDILSPRDALISYGRSR